jgi:hypothetical protein
VLKSQIEMTEVIMTRGKRLLWSLLCLTVFLAQGCASNKPLAKKDLESVKEITFVRYPSGYAVESTSSTVISGASALPVAALIGAPIAIGVFHSAKQRMMSDAGDEIQAKYNLPDFAEVVHKDLFEKLSPCFPRSSKLIYDAKPLDNTFRKTTDGLLTLETLVRIEDDFGLRTVATVKMTDSMNNVLWERKNWYNSIDYNRTSSVPLLVADGGKKLKEEVVYAAQLTVTDLVNEFNCADTTQGTEDRRGQ